MESYLWKVNPDNLSKTEPEEWNVAAKLGLLEQESAVIHVPSPSFIGKRINGG